MTGDPTTTTFSLRVNGEEVRVEDAWLGANLLFVLREQLGLPGSKNACEEGECGSCSVLLDDSLVCACCVLAVDAVGSSVTTIEGLGAGEAELLDVQQAFIDAGAVQCGFCTPGLVMAIHDLLRRDADADAMTVSEALSGNLCRCTGYGRVVAAVEAVQRARREAP